MSRDNKRGLTPHLRFREFHSDYWEMEELSQLAELIDERTEDKEYTTLSVTSGLGLVSQIEKFGREISGSSYKNYYVIRKLDFAYNKSATKLYPEGYISMLDNFEEGAVPNSIFTCFRVHRNKILPPFLNYLFHDNFHGKWLRKFIEVGARAHGSLSIDTDVLFKLPIVYPSIKEQQKIADCLSSLDELITAENQKLDALQLHKKGLMQQLFPAEGEKVPKLRFKEFKNSGEWVESPLGGEEVSNFVNEKTFSETLSLENYVSTENILADYVGITKASKLPQQTNVTKFVEGDVLISNIRPYLKKVWFSDRAGGASNDVIVVRAGKKLNSAFLSFLLKNDDFISYVMNGAQGVKMPRGDKSSMQEYPILFPEKLEQQKITDCLSSLDNLIIGQSQKVESLKAHKKGLMQRLFPRAIA